MLYCLKLVFQTKPKVNVQLHPIVSLLCKSSRVKITANCLSYVQDLPDKKSSVNTEILRIEGVEIRHIFTPENLKILREVIAVMKTSSETDRRGESVPNKVLWLCFKSFKL